MGKRIVIGVDLGTTTIKSIFLDTQENKIVQTLTKEIFPVKLQREDYIEFDPNLWWEYTLEMFKTAFSEGIDPNEVAGICFGGFTVMSLLVKKDGTNVTNAIHYNDMRHETVIEEAGELFGELAVARNYNHIGMYSGSVKQYWWKKFAPEIFESADYISTEVSYLNFRLTGKWAWNRTEAGFYSQYNADTKEWDDEIIAKMGFKRSMFPVLVDAWEVMGHISKEASQITGLPEDVLVFGGLDDASPVAIATGVIGVGQGFVSAGSGANIAANTKTPVSHATTISYPHCIPNLFSTITVMSSTGLSYKWMRNTFAQSECAIAERDDIDPYDVMNEIAKTAPAGSNGVIFLPYLDGDYTPNNDINAKGVFIGMSTATTKADMYRATLEGVAFSMLDNMALIRELGGEINDILITGGLAKSKLWLQIISDVTGSNISLPEETEGAPFGSAIVAAVGVGAYSDFNEAVAKCINIRKNAFIPNHENHSLYKELFIIYKGLYGCLKETYAALADIYSK